MFAYLLYVSQLQQQQQQRQALPSKGQVVASTLKKITAEFVYAINYKLAKRETLHKLRKGRLLRVYNNISNKQIVIKII